METALTATAAARRKGRPLSFDRAAALEQAMHAFWRHGYETTSISALTAAMGITAPSLYAAFGDKKRLFLEAMRLYAGSPDDLIASLAAAPSARDGVERMLRGAADAFTDPATPPGCLLASATASGSEDSADVRAAVAAVRSRIDAILRARIDRDIADHLLPSDTDSAALAGMTIALIQGLSVLVRDGAQRKALDAIIDTALRAWPASPAARGARRRV